MGSCGVGLRNGFNTLWCYAAREPDEASVLRSARDDGEAVQDEQA